MPACFSLGSADLVDAGGEDGETAARTVLGGHNSVMAGWGRVAVWVLAVLLGLALVGLGVWLGVADLDRADKLASVAGVFVGLVGLVLSVYGVVLARRAVRSSGDRGDGQVVERVHASSGLDVVDAVGGSVHLGAGQAIASGARAGTVPPQPLGEQSVRDVTSGGHVRVVRGVGGDVDSCS